MTQPDNPVSARSARPQLFGEAKPGTKAGRSHQPDFGPSILATIDGTPRRESKSRDAVSIKRVLWMSLVALAAVAMYFGVKFGMLPNTTQTPLVAVKPPSVSSSPTGVKTVEPPALTAAAAASAASTPVGVASIENIAPPAMTASASERVPAGRVAASLNAIQQVLAESEAKPEPPRHVDKPAAPKAVVATRGSTAEREVSATPKTAMANKPTNDKDAELLAAMLPHIKRRSSTGPTSPDFDKRCGQLAGDAAVECRARFCTGREGVDAACPSASGR